MNYCEKHNRSWLRKQLEHGKEEWFCPDCKQEKLAPFRAILEKNDGNKPAALAAKMVFKN